MGRFTSESLFGAAKQQIFYCCAIRDFVDSLTTSSPSYTLLQGSSFPEIKENSIFAVYDAAEGYRVFRAEDRLHYLTEASHAAA